MPNRPTDQRRDRDFRGRAAAGALLAAVLAVSLMGCTTSEPGTDVTEATAPPDTVAAPTSEAAGVGVGEDDQGQVVTDTDSERRTAELVEAAGSDLTAIVEDWADYDFADEVEASIGRNLGQGENAMELALEPADASSGIGEWLALSYDIGASEPHDFVGFDRKLDEPADWSGASAVAVWIDPRDAGDENVVLQWREGSGEVWRYMGPLAAAPSVGPLVIPLSSEYFERADWSTTENEQIDLGEVNQYGLYVGHVGPGRTGTVRFGPIVLVP